MKKKIIIITSSLVVTIGLIALIYFIFFNTKTLTCTSNIQDNYRTSKMEFKISYIRNKVTNIIQTSNHKFSSEESMDLYKDFLDDTYDKFKGKKNIIVTRNINELEYNIALEIKIKKINEEEAMSIDVSKKLDNMKEILSNSKFTCE